MKTTSHMVEKEIDDRAVLVSLVTQKQKRNEAIAEYSLQELVKLAETAGVQVLETMTQNKETKDSKWFIGKGKVDELRAMLEELGGNTAIFDQELSGAQVRNLEAALDVKIIDRTQLILDIFAQRAKTREGIIQVELAQLSYLLPRLSGQGKNLSRLGGGIGTRGPGESKLETDRRHIRGRIDELKAQLEEVVRHRTLHRERRKKTGVFQVALVGYTNAGKSTLLKQLTQADVYIENQLFATLDPTSRTMELPSGKEIVLTDTVGFIQNLPHDLVASFRATLEEANEADLILHVVDSSTDMRNEQMRVVGEVLQELGAHQKEQLTIFNKIDACSQEEREMLTTEGEFLKISAFDQADLERLRIAIQEKLMGESKEFRIPANKGDVISLMYRIGDVLETDVDGEDMIFKVRVNKDDYVKVAYQLVAYDQQAKQGQQEDSEGENY
ncbi:GTPase HflX [Paenibacillus sp. CGMCC 1.16610]|uniref:GTPase HflX n=1 Tax=Paenibacillus anseongense TaxID=2682845 RepID=A0ABW9UKI5_9BACL|nr:MULTISPECIES: GTPase HflX [Paenibacillus]MBA2940025.1 GTPase HflX [Paenibacillus sp. CGMCC 1.16610]MVQ38980.1 GTPase HflX [Paenibacillus anseongense]